MLKTTNSLISELKTEYKAPKNRILTLEKQNKIFKVTKGLYETEKNVSPFYLSSAIYGPSYISFESALSFWNLIPEKVIAVTSATFGKNKTKRFDTDFGVFLYRDVPKQVFPYEVYIKEDGTRRFLIAGKEKSICDILYRESPFSSQKQLKEFLFENLRIDEFDFYSLSLELLSELSTLYKSTNMNLLNSLIRKISNKKEEI